MSESLDVSFDRDKTLDLLCYGLGQGERLASTENPYKIGQHTEAMRRTILRLIRMFPNDFQNDLWAAFEEQQNEGTGKP